MGTTVFNIQYKSLACGYLGVSAFDVLLVKTHRKVVGFFHPKNEESI